MDLKKYIKNGALVLITSALVFGIIVLKNVFSENTKFTENEIYVQIPTDADYAKIKEIITQHLNNEQDNGREIWALLVLVHWLKLHS